MARVLQNEIEKHQSEEKALLKKRKELEKRGIKLPEVAGHQGGVHGVLAPGYNPKDSPDMFVKKIMTNQKRVQQTIDRYEKDQKEKKHAEESKPESLTQTQTQAQIILEAPLAKASGNLASDAA